MVYKLDLKYDQSDPSPVIDSSSPASAIDDFIPWQSSTWPDPLPLDNHNLTMVIKRIFEGAVLNEINNVIEDAMARTESLNHPGSLDHRGFVVCVSLFCALDAISAFGYGGESGNQIPRFIKAHFPNEYWPFAKELKKIYRNASVHSWNLFGAEILAGNEAIAYRNDRISLGLLNFFDALKLASEDFLNQLSFTPELQRMARIRYELLLSRRKGRLGPESAMRLSGEEPGT